MLETKYLLDRTQADKKMKKYPHPHPSHPHTFTLTPSRPVSTKRVIAP